MMCCLGATRTSILYMDKAYALSEQGSKNQEKVLGFLDGDDQL